MSRARAGRRTGDEVTAAGDRGGAGAGCAGGRTLPLAAEGAVTVPDAAGRGSAPTAGDCAREADSGRARSPGCAFLGGSTTGSDGVTVLDRGADGGRNTCRGTGARVETGSGGLTPWAGVATRGLGPGPDLPDREDWARGERFLDMNSPRQIGSPAWRRLDRVGAADPETAHRRHLL